VLSSASRVSPLTRIRNKEKSTNKIQMKLRPFAYFKQSSLKTDKTLSASPWAKLGLLLRGEKIALLHLIFFGRQKKWRLQLFSIILRSTVKAIAIYRVTEFQISPPPILRNLETLYPTPSYSTYSNESKRTVQFFEPRLPWRRFGERR
jgi:hypothetical protein